MHNILKIISLDEHIEEEAVVQINDIEFVTFIAYAPYPVEVNKQYPVEISLFVDDEEVKVNNDKIKGLTRIGETFEYIINGYLNDKGQLDVGFLIEDEIFENYQYLYGEHVTLRVDRINSELLEENKVI